MKMKLVVDGVEVNVGVEFQKQIISIIPNSPIYKDLFHILSQSNDADIRREVAYNDSISEETAILLMEDENYSVLDAIIVNDVAKPLVGLDKLKTIIENSGSGSIDSIIYGIEGYTQIDPVEIFDFIYNLDEPFFNLVLADFDETPDTILHELAISDDPDIRSCAENSLQL